VKQGELVIEHLERLLLASARLPACISITAQASAKSFGRLPRVLQRSFWTNTSSAIGSHASEPGRTSSRTRRSKGWVLSRKSSIAKGERSSLTTQCSDEVMVSKGTCGSARKGGSKVASKRQTSSGGASMMKSASWVERGTPWTFDA
jgi:hypothetical protein